MPPTPVNDCATFRWTNSGRRRANSIKTRLKSPRSRPSPREMCPEAPRRAVSGRRCNTHTAEFGAPMPPASGRPGRAVSEIRISASILERRLWTAGRGASGGRRGRLRRDSLRRDGRAVRAQYHHGRASVAVGCGRHGPPDRRPHDGPASL